MYLCETVMYVRYGAAILFSRHPYIQSAITLYDTCTYIIMKIVRDEEDSASRESRSVKLSCIAATYI